MTQESLLEDAEGIRIRRKDDGKGLVWKDILTGSGSDSDE